MADIKALKDALQAEHKTLVDAYQAARAKYEAAKAEQQAAKAELHSFRIENDRVIKALGAVEVE